MGETFLDTDQSSVWSRILVMPPTEACYANSVTHRQCKWVATSLGKVAYLSVITRSLSWLASVHSLSDLMSGYSNPASGYLNNSNGTLNNVGSNGYYWSATPNSQSNGYNLNFNSSNVNPANNNNRANGFPVRCVQEFAKCQKVSAHVPVL